MTRGAIAIITQIDIPPPSIFRRKLAGENDWDAEQTTVLSYAEPLLKKIEEVMRAATKNPVANINGHVVLSFALDCPHGMTFINFLRHQSKIIQKVKGDFLKSTKGWQIELYGKKNKDPKDRSLLCVITEKKVEGSA